MTVEEYLQSAKLHGTVDVEDLWAIPSRCHSDLLYKFTSRTERVLAYADRVARIITKARRAYPKMQPLVIAQETATYLAEPGAWRDAVLGCLSWASVSIPEALDKPDVWIIHLGVGLDALLGVDEMQYHDQRAQEMRDALRRMRPDKESSLQITLQIPLPCHPESKADFHVDLRRDAELGLTRCPICFKRYATTCRGNIVSAEGERFTREFDFEPIDSRKSV